jgi:hypothetical protein
MTAINGLSKKQTLLKKGDHMDKYCHSCTMPLGMPDAKGPAENYCKYCTDEKGNLKPRAAVQQGIAGWFKSWQPGIDDKKAMKRADLFMKGLPAWAED